MDCIDDEDEDEEGIGSNRCLLDLLFLNVVM